MKFMPKPLKEKFKRCGCKSNCKVFCKLDQKEPKFGGDITDKVIITLFSSGVIRRKLRDALDKDYRQIDEIVKKILKD